MRYDVLVIGSEISGIVSAALLAKKGYSVAIVTGEASPSVHEKKGYRFVDPSMLITGIRRGRLGKVFDAMRIPRDTFVSSDISYQVVLPDERIDIFMELEPFIEEVKRAFPEDQDKIAEFYRCISEFIANVDKAMELDPFRFHLFLPSWARQGKRPLDELMSKLGLSERFRGFINAQIAAFSFFDAPPSLLSASLILQSHRNGIYYSEGGIDSLKSLIVNKIESHEGDILDSRPKALKKEQGEWLLTTDSGMVSAGIIIANMKLAAFCNLNEDLGGGCLKKVSRIEKDYYPFTVNLGVKGAGVPAGMAQNLVMVKGAGDAGKEFCYGDTMFFQTGPLKDDRRTMTVTCQIPKERYGKEFSRENAGKVLERVDRLCPFIDRHVEVLDILTPEDPRDGRFTASLKNRMGIGILPFEMQKGVYYAGPEVFPSLGFEGLIYSGEMAASSAVKTLERGKR